MRAWLLILTGVTALAAGEPPAVTHARQEWERVRELVAAGTLAPAKLAEAQTALDDASDEAVLDQTLYAHLEVEDLNETQTDGMVTAAERRLERQRARLARVQKLISDGLVAHTELADLESELARRRLAFGQATARAGLVLDLVETAHAEEVVAEEVRDSPRKERVDGDGVLQPEDLKALTLAFEKEFGKPMRVSARGSTAVHRALGFDHTGRIDIAVTPDALEGVWLRRYLEERFIPYYVFRSAIAGKATAAHIHIGPGSTRLLTTD